MRVTIDRNMCCGHALCVDEAPEVFEIADDGIAVLLIEDPGEELRKKIESAVRLCPEMAIGVFDR